MSKRQRKPQSESDRERDHEVVRRALVGDQDAFAVIYNAYLPRVHAFTSKRVGDPIEAEDLAQETFLQLYRSLESYEGRSSLPTYTKALDPTAADLAKDLHAKARKGVVLPAAFDPVAEAAVWPMATG